MTTSPTLDEFKNGVCEAFCYLKTDFGFSEMAAPADANPYLVQFSSSTTVVTVEGIHWGFGAQVLVGPAEPSDPSDWLSQVPLWAVLKCRRPDVHEAFAEATGQLGEVRYYAQALREAASDVLRGDFSILADAREVIESQELACYAGRLTRRRS